MCGYCLDMKIIYLDIQVNTVITIPRRNYGSPITPAPPPVFNIHLTKNIIKLLNKNDVKFDFRMGSILVLFPFLLKINVQFTNFVFLNFLFFYFQN